MSPPPPVPGAPGRRSFLARALFLAIPSAAATAAVARPQVRVVYHLDDEARAIATVRMLQNHLKADAQARIVVVALAGGVDFLLAEAKDDRGNPYEPMVDDLVAAGVSFRVCGNTLEFRHIPVSAVHPEASVVISGAAEIARLQVEEGHAYYKP